MSDIRHDVIMNPVAEARRDAEAAVRAMHRGDAGPTSTDPARARADAAEAARNQWKHSTSKGISE